jgi:ribosomal protein S14
MLRALPFQTIGDIARYGLELHVYCSRCFATRRLDLEVNTALHGRAIATTRFRCRRCGTPGVPKIRPAELLPVGGSVTLAFLWCNSCIWEIDQAQLDKPPWSGSRQRYRCPGCGRPVDWHVHGPVWRPGGNNEGRGDVSRHMTRRAKTTHRLRTPAGQTDGRRPAKLITSRSGRPVAI